MTTNGIKGSTADSPLAGKAAGAGAFEGLSASLKQAGIHPSQSKASRLEKYGNPPHGYSDWTDDGEPVRWIYINRNKDVHVNAPLQVSLLRRLAQRFGLIARPVAASPVESTTARAEMTHESGREAPAVYRKHLQSKDGISKDWHV